MKLSESWHSICAMLFTKTFSWNLATRFETVSKPWCDFCFFGVCWSLFCGGFFGLKVCALALWSVNFQRGWSAIEAVSLLPVPPAKFNWRQWITASSCGFACAIFWVLHWLFSLEDWCLHCCGTTRIFGLAIELSRGTFFLTIVFHNWYRNQNFLVWNFLAPEDR